MNEILQAAAGFESLGISGVMFLIVIALGAVVYKYIVKEHDRVMGALDILINKIASDDQKTAIFDRVETDLSKAVDRAFSLNETAQEKILKNLESINAKLDRLLTAKPVPPRNGRKLIAMRGRKSR